MINENNNYILDDNNIENKFQRNVAIPFLSYEDNDYDLDLNSSKKDEKNKKKIPIFDLNNIFQFKFSYNYELLKNLLETMIQNQQESQKEFLKMEKNNELKINEMEKKIIDLKIKLNNNSNPQILEELKKEKESIQKESEKIQNKILKEKNLKKEEKENITNLTVSNK